MKSNIGERTIFLLEELRRYEEITDMSEEERTALHEWVSEGNSVHEVLKKYGLLPEAEALMEDWKANAAVFPKFRDDELPFQETDNP